jgi:hypothetical protein
MPKNPDEPTAAPEPTATLETLPAPETFPMGLDEYAATVGLHYLWKAGLEAYAGLAERYRPEWDALLAAFKDRPVQS